MVGPLVYTYFSTINSPVTELNINLVHSENKKTEAVFLGSIFLHFYQRSKSFMKNSYILVIKVSFNSLTFCVRIRVFSPFS